MAIFPTVRYLSPMISLLLTLVLSTELRAAEPYTFPISKLVLAPQDVAKIQAFARNERRFETLVDEIHEFYHLAEVGIGVHRDRIFKSLDNAKAIVRPIISSVNPPDDHGVKLLVDFLTLFYQSLQWSFEVTEVEVYHFVVKNQKVLGVSSAALSKAAHGVRRDLLSIQDQIQVLRLNDKLFLEASAFQTDQRIPGLRKAISQLDRDFRSLSNELKSYVSLP